MIIPGAVEKDVVAKNGFAARVAVEDCGSAEAAIVREVATLDVERVGAAVFRRFGIRQVAPRIIRRIASVPRIGRVDAQAVMRDGFRAQKESAMVNQPAIAVGENIIAVQIDEQAMINSPRRGGIVSAVINQNFSLIALDARAVVHEGYASEASDDVGLGCSAEEAAEVAPGVR